MKKIKYLLILASVTLLSSFSQPIFAQENNFIKEYLERLEKSKEYLILVAETMPEDKYEFKATPESMSFAENLMHIGWAMDWKSRFESGRSAIVRLVAECCDVLFKYPAERDRRVDLCRRGSAHGVFYIERS